MSRFQDWPTRMDAWLKAHAQDVHAYGAWDCALMSAAHVDNLTGSDVFSQHVGKYSDVDSSAAYLSSLGVDGLAGLATQLLGEPIRAVKLAQRGDVAVFPTDLGPALGIVDLSGRKILGLNPSLTGFIRLPLTYADAVWRV